MDESIVHPTIDDPMSTGTNSSVANHLLIAQQDSLFFGLAIGSTVLAMALLAAFLVWNQQLRRKAGPHQSKDGSRLTDTWTDASQNRRKILLYSLGIMSILTICVGAIAIYLLYSASFEQQRQRLVETTSAQARLIEAVARFDRTYSQEVEGGSSAATISQLVDAHRHQSGLGETGEFTMAKLEGDEMVFLFERRHAIENQSLRIPYQGSPLAEPMRLALSGETGTTISTDYRGVTVLAAYEPVGVLGMGIVAKIDLAEIRRPFVRAGQAALAVAVLLILGGGLLLVWVNAPLIRRVEERERRLDAIVSNAADGIFALDSEGRVLSFNQAAESIFGHGEEEIIGRSVAVLVQGVEGDVKPKLAKLRGERQEGVGLRKNGEAFPMEVAVNPMDQGESPTYVGIARDVTDRKRMEKEMKRVNFLSDIALDLTGCGYWHVDYSDPDYYHQSERAARMLGEPLKSDMRYHLQDEWFARLVEANPETAELTNERYQGAIEGRYEQYESTYAYKRPADGKIIWLHAMGKIVRDDDGKTRYMYGAYQDITLRKQAEMAMQQAQQAAEEARAAAESANRAKSDFLSHMSHELRTPLNGILGYAQILQRDSEVTGGQRNHVQSIVNCGEHLLTLINDVLDLSKIEAGKVEVDAQPCNLHKLLQAVGDIVGQRARGKGLKFEMVVSPEVPQCIVTDAAKLRQILINLAGNAVKFTEQGSVTVSIAESPTGTLHLEVIDTGIGMSEHEVQVIFDAFRQVEAGKDAGGTGLGLSICKRLAEAMDGGISVTSTPGEGSTFSVRLPLVEAPHDEATALAGDGETRDEPLRLAPGQRSTILVADDRDTNREVLKSLLESSGFDVLLAVDGQNALEELRANAGVVDLVLMDVRMPRLNGIEALKLIRADEKLKHMKVIAVTASVFPEFRQQAIQSGFDDFLGKPFRAGDLMQKLKTHVQIEFESEHAVAVAESSTADDTAHNELPTLSAENLDRLKQALEIKNLTAITGVAMELKADGSTHKLGEQIHECVSSFDFARLKKLVSQLEAASD
ncbi:MAG: PAS domain S-box protein [Pirellulaceae bacterium]